MRSTVRRAMAVGAVLAAFAVAGSVALAAIPTTGGTVYSCYNTTTGVMRAINYPTKRCTSKERMVALASATVMPKHVAGTFIGSYADPALTAMYRLQVDATATGALRDGVDESNGMGGPENRRTTTPGARSTRSASSRRPRVRPRAEITGWECLLEREPAGTDLVGTCWPLPCDRHRRRVEGAADTFCGGHADVTAVNDPLYCPYVWRSTRATSGSGRAPERH